MQLKVRKFDPDTMKPNRIILCVGRRSTGKSSLLIDLLYRTRDRYDYVMGFCPTYEGAAALRRCIPDACVYDQYNASKVDALVKTAQELVAQGKKRSMLLVLDDCLYDSSIARGTNTSFRCIFMNGRHLNLSLIILAQWALDLPPAIRSQVDYVFQFKDNILANKIKIYKMFFGVFQFDEFCAVMERCTQNYECLCIDNTLQSTSPVDCVSWYKAQINLPEFSLGRKIFFQLTDNVRRPAGSYVREEEDPQGKSKLRVTVTKEGGGDDPEGGGGGPDEVR